MPVYYELTPPRPDPWGDDWFPVKEGVPSHMLTCMVRKYGPSDRAVVVYTLAVNSPQPKSGWTLDDLGLLCIRYSAHQIAHAVADLISCGMATKELVGPSRLTVYRFRYAFTSVKGDREFRRDYPITVVDRDTVVYAEGEDRLKGERLPLPALQDD